MVQTTAAISPGSSGGALVDDQGRFVGVTTFKIRGGESLNFAVDVSRVQDIQDSLLAARLFQAVYERKVVQVGSEEERDYQYIESNALTKWMLDSQRPDGTPTFKWFKERLDSSMRGPQKFWGGNPEFEAFQAEFLATRQRTSSQPVAAAPGAVRLTCRMHATSDGTYRFELNVVYDPAKETVNGLPARVTAEEIVFKTGKDAAFTATINRFSLQSRIDSVDRPTLLNGACVLREDRKF